MKKSWQHLQFIRSILVGKEVPDNAQVFRAERYFCETFGSHTDSHCSFCCSYELTRWNFHEGNENGNVQERRQSKACVDLLIRAQGDKAECFNPLEINFFFLLKHKLRALRRDSWGCQEVLQRAQHIVFMLRRNNNVNKPHKAAKSHF